MALILLGLLALLAGNGECALRLSSYFADHMVLQRGPQRAVLWGSASTQGDTVTVTVAGAGAYVHNVTATVAHGQWKVKLPAVSDFHPRTITVHSSEGSVTLRDVLFGDVWLCSGQSNMYFPMASVMNATAEVSHAIHYPNVRFTRAKLVESPTPKDTMDFDVHWTRPTPQNVRLSSAVCWLYGEYLYDHLKVPIGLVESSWGGTPIEAWSPPEALADCSHHNKRGPRAHSVLWNAMINPLLGNTIKGAIWYQGEANARSAAQYSCQIKAMVDHWRSEFNQHSMSETDQQFPFGYVQLAGHTHNDAVGTFPGERWAQTANYGYSPNPELPDTFMAVAMDLPDFNSTRGTIHPRYKQDVAERLVQGALHVAYGHSDVTFQGPFPTRFTRHAAQHALTIEYDHGHTPLEIRTTDGYEICCSSASTTTCTDATDTWVAAPIKSHDAGHVTVSTSGCGARHLVGLRYEWKTSPCDYKMCTLYASDSDLPAPPYITRTLPQ